MQLQNPMTGISAGKSVPAADADICQAKPPLQQRYDHQEKLPNSETSANI